MLVKIMRRWTLDGGELVHMQDRHRRLPLTRSGLRRAAWTVGAQPTRLELDEATEALVRLSLHQAHRAAAEVDPDERWILTAAAEVDAVCAWADDAAAIRAGGAA